MRRIAVCLGLTVLAGCGERAETPAAEPTPVPVEAPLPEIGRAHV